MKKYLVGVLGWGTLFVLAVAFFARSCVPASAQAPVVPCTQVSLDNRGCVPDTPNTPHPVWLSPGDLPVTASATGTTGATTATIAAVAGKTAYLCGFSIRANATAAATGNATVTGLITGTLNYTQWTAPLASGIGVIEPPLGMCIPASAANQAIAVVSAAPGSGGVVSVSAQGYYK